MTYDRGCAHCRALTGTHGLPEAAILPSPPDAKRPGAQDAGPSSLSSRGRRDDRSPEVRDPQSTPRASSRARSSRRRLARPERRRQTLPLRRTNERLAPPHTQRHPLLHRRQPRRRHTVKLLALHFAPPFGIGPEGPRPTGNRRFHSGTKRARSSDARGDAEAASGFPYPSASSNAPRTKAPRDTDPRRASNRSTNPGVNRIVIRGSATDGMSDILPTTPDVRHQQPRGAYPPRGGVSSES
jgi:hypothetical protein